MLFLLKHINSNLINVFSVCKFNLINYNQIPNLKYITVYVWIRKLDNYLVPEIVTAFCTLIYLTKKRPFILKMGAFKEFRKVRNDLFIFVRLSNVFEMSYVYSNFLLEMFRKVSKFDYVVSFLINRRKRKYIGHVQIQQFNGVSFMETSSLFLYWRRCFLGMYLGFYSKKFKHSIIYFSLLKFLNKN